MKKIIFILVIIILLIGCTNEQKISPSEDNNVIISPSELFVGDTKKLEPHMDLTTGSVKVNYSGEKEFIRIKYEIWENGESTKENIILSSMIKNGFNGEISFSIKKLINDELEPMELFKLKSVVSKDNGYSASTTYIDEIPLEYSYGPTQLEEEIKANEDEEIIIWGVIASKNGNSAYYNDINRTLVSADLALVLMMEFKDDIENE